MHSRIKGWCHRRQRRIAQEESLFRKLVCDTFRRRASLSFLFGESVPCGDPSVGDDRAASNTPCICLHRCMLKRKSPQGKSLMKIYERKFWIGCYRAWCKTCEALAGLYSAVAAWATEISPCFGRNAHEFAVTPNGVDQKSACVAARRRIALEVEAMARAYKQGSIGYTACVGCSQCGENLPDDVELYGRCRACNPLETFCERSECGCVTRFGALSHEEVDSK